MVYDYDYDYYCDSDDEPDPDPDTMVDAYSSQNSSYVHPDQALEPYRPSHVQTDTSLVLYNPSHPQSEPPTCFFRGPDDTPPLLGGTVGSGTFVPRHDHCVVSKTGLKNLLNRMDIANDREVREAMDEIVENLSRVSRGRNKGTTLEPDIIHLPWQTFEAAFHTTESAAGGPGLYQASDWSRHVRDAVQTFARLTYLVSPQGVQSYPARSLKPFPVDVTTHGVWGDGYFPELPPSFL